MDPVHPRDLCWDQGDDSVSAHDRAARLPGGRVVRETVAVLFARVAVRLTVWESGSMIADSDSDTTRPVLDAIFGSREAWVLHIRAREKELMAP